jgi:hypothetical protein
MIGETRDIQPALGHLEAALEETCATLMALEAARVAGQGGAAPPAIQRQLGRATACVRNAMSELRALHDIETSMLAYGFVLSDPEWARTQARRRPAAPGQDRPRRTA